MKERTKKILIASTIVIILVASVTGGIIYIAAKNVDAEVGLIQVSIDGDEAFISVELTIKPDTDADISDLTLELDQGPANADYIDGYLEVVLDEYQFREILEKDTVDVKGKAKIPVGPFNVGSSFREEVDVSFIREISNSLNVTDVNVNFTLFSRTEVDFRLNANVTRDFDLYINNTEASLISPAGSFSATVMSLNYRTGEEGTARISIPAISVLGLALYHRDIQIECWGITADVEIPLFSR